MVFYFDIDAPDGEEKWVVYMVRPRKHIEEQRRRKKKRRMPDDDDDDGSSTPSLPPPTFSENSFPLRQPTTGPRQVREREPDRARPPARHLVPRRGHELGACLPAAAELAAPRCRRVFQARQGRRGQQQRRRSPVPERQARSGNSSRRRSSLFFSSPHHRAESLARHPEAGPRRLLPARQAQQHLRQQSSGRRRRVHSRAQPPEERQDGHGAGMIDERGCCFLFFL